MITLFLAAHAADVPLTYEQVLTDALLANPRVQRAQLDIDAATMGVRSALGFLDPTAGLDGTWRTSKSRGFFQGFPFTSDSRTWDLGANLSGTLPTGTNYALNAGLDRNFSSFVTDFGIGGMNENIQDAYTSNFNVTLTQQILKGFRVAYNLQNVVRSKQSVTASELQALNTAQEVIAETARAYWTWAHQVRLEAIAREAVTTSAEALRVAELKLQAGEIAPLERTRLQAAAVQAEVNAMEAALAADQALQTLLALRGEDPLATIPYVPGSTPIAGEVGQIDRARAVEVALAGNLQLRLAQATLDNAGVSLGNARHALLPSLAATASAGIGAQDTDAGAALLGVAKDQAFPYLQVGGSFSMPLGNRAARGEASRLAVEQDRARIDLAELQRTIQASVVRQVDVVNSGALRVRLAESNQALAQEALAAEEALQAAGRSIQKNLLDARAEVTRTAAEVSKARTDQQLALVELQRLQGGLTGS